MRDKLVKLGAGASVFATGLFLAVAPVLAAAPAMDEDIQTGVVDLVTGMKDTIFANILVVLPIAGIVLVTLLGINVLIGYFHRFARH